MTHCCRVIDWITLHHRRSQVGRMLPTRGAKTDHSTIAKVQVGQVRNVDIGTRM